MNTKVSVIIPVYNTSIYLQECLESLVNQTLKEIEIICVNDGSTDNSLEILEEYAKKDNRIIIINQENKGQSAARNKGIDAAKGEFIGFLDSDDKAAPEMFEKLHKNAIQNNSKISMCSVFMYNEKTGATSDHDGYMSLDIFDDSFKNRPFRPEETFDFIFKICVTPWNKIYKTEFLKQNNLKFIEGLNFEDNVFFVDAYTSAETVSLIDEPLVIYRQASQTSYSYAAKKHDAKRLDFFRIFEFEEEILKRKKLFKTLKKYFLWHKKDVLVYWYNRLEDDDIKQVYKNKLKKLYPQIRVLKLIKFINQKIQLLKLKKLLKTKKIVFWGASLYLEEFLKTNKINDPNILGIIDKSALRQGEKICGYEIFPPSKLKELNPDVIIPAVINLYKFENTLKKSVKIKTEKILDSDVLVRLKD